MHACGCRVYQERGVVDGWGLAHSLLADCCDDILGVASSDASSAAAAERDAWTLVASLAANPARDNCLGARDLPAACCPVPRRWCAHRTGGHAPAAAGGVEYDRRGCCCLHVSLKAVEKGWG